MVSCEKYWVKNEANTLSHNKLIKAHTVQTETLKNINYRNPTLSLKKPVELAWNKKQENPFFKFVLFGFLQIFKSQLYSFSKLGVKIFF